MLRAVIVVASRGHTTGSPRAYASRMRRSSWGSNRATASLTIRSRKAYHDLSELLAPRQALEGRAPVRDGEHAVDDGAKASRAQLRDDGIEFGIVPHRRPHDRPLIPKQAAHIRLDDRTGGRPARHQSPASSERAERLLPSVFPHVVDDNVDAAFVRFF